jgi:hypothetical protein
MRVGQLITQAQLVAQQVRRKLCTAKSQAAARTGSPKVKPAKKGGIFANAKTALF